MTSSASSSASSRGTWLEVRTAWAGLGTRVQEEAGLGLKTVPSGSGAGGGSPESRTGRHPSLRVLSCDRWAVSTKPGFPTHRPREESGWGGGFLCGAHGLRYIPGGREPALSGRPTCLVHNNLIAGVFSCRPSLSGGPSAPASKTDTTSAAQTRENEPACVCKVLEGRRAWCTEYLSNSRRRF